MVHQWLLCEHGSEKVYLFQRSIPERTPSIPQHPLKPQNNDHLVVRCQPHSLRRVPFDSIPGVPSTCGVFLSQKMGAIESTGRLFLEGDMTSLSLILSLQAIFTYKPLTTLAFLIFLSPSFSASILSFFFPHPPILNCITLCHVVPSLFYLVGLYFLLQLLIRCFHFVHLHYIVISVLCVHRTQDPTKAITPLVVMMAYERNNRTYELQMAQNPVRARMCGFGEKVI